MDHIDIGPTPYDEICTPAGRDPRREQAECVALKHQMLRIMGPEPEGARLTVKYFHTGGGYRELVCEYDENNPEAKRYAFECERNVPARWDIMAQVELTAGTVPFLTELDWAEVRRFLK